MRRLRRHQFTFISRKMEASLYKCEICRIEVTTYTLAGSDARPTLSDLPREIRNLLCSELIVTLVHKS